MASVVEGDISIENIKLLAGYREKKKQLNHIWKIADTLFEDDVLENISDVNRGAQIIYVGKRTSLSISSFNITATISF